MAAHEWTSLLYKKDEELCAPERSGDKSLYTRKKLNSNL